MASKRRKGIFFKIGEKKSAQNVGKKITPTYLEKFYESLPRRMAASNAQREVIPNINAFNIMIMLVFCQ